MDKVGKAILMAAAKGPDIGAVKDGLSWFKEKDNYDEVSLPPRHADLCAPFIRPVHAVS